MIQITMHELVHLLTFKLDISVLPPKLLTEGIATYLSNQMNDAKFNKIVQDYTNNSLKKISDFIIYNGNEFANLNGYAYSYFVFSFLNKVYSKEKIMYYLKNPDRFINDVPNLEQGFNEYIVQTIKDYLAR